MLLELLSVDAAREVTGGLSTTSKMPCASYSLPATACGVGSRMHAKGREMIAALPSKQRTQARVMALIEEGEVDASACTWCYARKGNYARPSTQAAMHRRLASITDPRWPSAMATLILADGRPFYRWHDSGDLQSVEHLEAIVEVCRSTLDVAHWLPTQERRIVRDYCAKHGVTSETIAPNLVVRFSAPLVNHAPDVDIISSYVVANAPVADGVHSCPAPKQEGECGDCRACWSPEVKTVAYHVH